MKISFKLGTEENSVNVSREGADRAQQFFSDKYPAVQVTVREPVKVEVQPGQQDQK